MTPVDDGTEARSAIGGDRDRLRETASLTDRIRTRLKPLKSSARVDLDVSPGASDAELRKAEAAIGRSLSSPLRAFFRDCGGLVLRVERDGRVAELHLVGLREAFGGRSRSEPWDDNAYRGVLWQPDFCDLEAETFARFQKLRPLVWLDNLRAFAFDVRTDEVFHVDRWTLTRVEGGVEALFEACVDTLGFERWDEVLIGRVWPRFAAEKKRFFKRAKRGTWSVGDRIVANRVIADPQVDVRGEIVALKGRRAAIEFDFGRRGWLRKASLRRAPEDRYEAWLADPERLGEALTCPLVEVLEAWSWFDLPWNMARVWDGAVNVMGLVRRMPEVDAVRWLLDVADRFPAATGRMRTNAENRQVREWDGFGFEHLVDAIVLRATYENLVVGSSGARDRWPPSLVSRYEALLARSLRPDDPARTAVGHAHNILDPLPPEAPYEPGVHDPFRMVRDARWEVLRLGPVDDLDALLADPARWPEY
ncbi:MAG: hypothetical protein AAGE52_10330 [Myxococcota bacterium]